MASDPVLSRPQKCLCGEPLSSSASSRVLCFGCVAIALQAFIERWRRPRQCPCGYSRRDQQCAGLLEAANEIERFAQALQEDEPAGSVTLSAEDARGLAYLLARAIREDDDASDGDRREARKLLEKLGGDTQ